MPFYHLFLCLMLTRNMPQEDYGHFSISQALLVGLGPYVTLNGVGATGRQFYEKNILNIEITFYIGSCVQILILSFLFSGTFYFVVEVESIL